MYVCIFTYLLASTWMDEWIYLIATPATRCLEIDSHNVRNNYNSEQNS